VIGTSRTRNTLVADAPVVKTLFPAVYDYDAEIISYTNLQQWTGEFALYLPAVDEDGTM